MYAHVLTDLLLRHRKPLNELEQVAHSNQCADPRLRIGDNARGSRPDSRRRRIATVIMRGRKVRAPQGKVPGNAWAARADGKCNREQTADGRASGTGKGETVR